jgi:hypothetical protein
MKPLMRTRYLASLPCYNPFELNIPHEKMQKRIHLLTELGLQAFIGTHRENMNLHSAIADQVKKMAI